MVSLPIQIPLEATILIKVGQTVGKGQEIAKLTGKNEFVIDLKKALGMPLRKIPKHLTKNPGDRVAKGEAVAVKKTMFAEEKIESTIEGTVITYKRDSGELIIQANEVPEVPSGTSAITSPVAGKVSVCDNGQIVIETAEKGIVGTQGIGSVVKGQTFVISYIDDETTGQKTPHLRPDAINKIIIGKAFLRDVLIRAIGMEVLGIVGTEIKKEDLEYIVSKKLTVPIIQIRDEDYETVAKAAGMYIAVDGNTGTILML